MKWNTDSVEVSPGVVSMTFNNGFVGRFRDAFSRCLLYVPTMASPSLSILVKMIDHSLLHPTVTDDEVLRRCNISSGATRIGFTAIAAILDEAKERRFT